jgi:hypothetical protein
MKARVFALGLAAVLCTLPLLAASPPDIPAGNDVWDTPNGGGTNTVLTSADWFALCGVSVPDTAVQFKGFNLAGQGTGDTVVTRLSNASLPTNGSTATVNIQLYDLSFVSDGSHPCSPNTLRVRKFGTQAIGTMTITRTSTIGGTFSASVPVTAKIEAVNSSGTVVGSTLVNGTLNDTSSSPWSYAPPSSGAPQAGPWYPGIDPVTKAPVRVCRIGNKTMPAQHCYRPAPKCGTITGTGTGTVNPTSTATAIDDHSGDVEVTPAEPVVVAAEPCYIQATPIDDTVK